MTSDGVRVALRSADPLVAGFLRHQLEAAGIEVFVVRTFEAAELADADVVLWDPGPGPDVHEARAVDQIPTLVLCATPEVGAAALQAGCLGAVDRSRPIEGLALAIQAVSTGLLVTEPGWTDTTAPVQADSPLTPREHDVLEHMAEGLSNRDIGQQLFVSEHTVRFHVRAILEKLQATSRTQAVVHAARAGLLDF